MSEIMLKTNKVLTLHISHVLLIQRHSTCAKMTTFETLKVLTFSLSTIDIEDPKHIKNLKGKMTKISVCFLYDA